jgi:hypothetical protein
MSNASIYGDFDNARRLLANSRKLKESKLNLSMSVIP